MTELAFHFGAPDKLAYACRLLRKAVRGGARVAVVAEATALAQLDVDLWGVSPTDAADREQARNRWRLYTGQGYAIIRHDLNLKRAD